MPAITAKHLALLAELQALVAGVVRASPGDHLADKFEAAAVSLRMTRRRVKAWFYGEVQRVDPFEPETIRQRAITATRSRVARLSSEIERLQLELDEEIESRAPRRAAAMAGIKPPRVKAARRR